MHEPRGAILTDRAIPPDALREFAAAVFVARETHAAIDLEVSCDPKGNIRCRTVAVRGASAQALAGVDKAGTIEGT